MMSDDTRPHGEAERGASLSAADLGLAEEFVAALSERYDPGLYAVTLYGSRARGEGDAESDLDLFVAYRGRDENGAFKAAARDVACDLTLKHGILVSVFVADEEFLARHQGYSLLETVAEEGVRL